MFDNIHFREFNAAELIISSDMQDYWYSTEDYQQAGDISMITAAINADYSISGSVSLLPLRPVSAFAKEHYLYLQSFGLIHSDENYYTRRENYDSYLILFTYSGAGYLEYNGLEYYLKEGDGFFIDCRKPHFYRSDSKLWLHSVLHFDGVQVSNFFQLFEKRGSVRFSSSINGFYQYHLENLVTIYDRSPCYMELQISNEIYQLLTEIIVKADNIHSNTNSLSEVMRYLIKYMESNYNLQLTLDYLAKFSGISKYHLCREFKKYSGFTPNEYLIRLRIEQAKFLLHNTKITVARIAQLVGIPDENNFNYHFKKREGITPGKFRSI